jgi:hypothetical protein
LVLRLVTVNGELDGSGIDRFFDILIETAGAGTAAGGGRW